jgi:hypothetical protein
MKTKLLSTKQNSNAFYMVLMFCMCFNYGWSQTNLVLNSTMDEYSVTTNDNSDAWDMSPPSKVIPDDGIEIDSPYRALWNNGDLDSWLNTNCGDSNEAPGSSSDGNWDYSAGAGNGVKTRGVKINEACRRLYQKVAVTSGVSYTLQMQSRSGVAGVPSEVYILNTEIADEVGLTSTSSTVDAYFDITNDFNADKSNATDDNFAHNSFVFTPSGSFIVIYVRSPNVVDDANAVYFDNIELYATAELSINDLLASKFKVYPNPARDYIQIESKDEQISSLEMFTILGGKLSLNTKLKNNRMDISHLSSGMYLLKINVGKKSTIKRIIVQ